MLSPFIINDRNAFLDRYPPNQVNRSLQAWDAADEYIINHLNENQLITDSHKANILIFNDNFGALAVNFSTHNVTCVNDSFISQQGIYHNFEQNLLETNEINLLGSIASLPEKADIILYKIPKSKALMAEQLAKIALQYPESTCFIAGARAKDIHSSTLKVFEQYLGTTKTSLAVKKARLVFSQLDQTNKQPLAKVKSWQLPNSSFTITNLANVFARESLDIGARLFLEHLPEIKANQQVIDLGCGNGVLGLSALSQQPEAQISFYDESFMAVASAQANIEQNLPSQLNQCQFVVDDCLTSAPTNGVDIILCNPPFHQQQATTDHIAWQMFNDSFKALKKGGQLRIVGNRQLGYHVKLKRIFGNCQTIASNKKFVILSAIKK